MIMTFIAELSVKVKIKVKLGSPNVLWEYKVKYYINNIINIIPLYRRSCERIKMKTRENMKIRYSATMKKCEKFLKNSKYEMSH